MELLIIGGDMRCAHLARLMDKRGMDVRAIGLEKALVPLDICAGQDALEDADETGNGLAAASSRDQIAPDRRQGYAGGL